MPRGARRTVPRRAPPHPSAHAPQGAQRTAGRAAYRAARGAAQRRAGRGRRAHRCAAPHRSPERTSASRRAAAAHALSTSRSVLHTDHLRAAPSYFVVVLRVFSAFFCLTYGVISCYDSVSSRKCGFKTQLYRHVMCDGIRPTAGRRAVKMPRRPYAMMCTMPFRSKCVALGTSRTALVA